MSNEPGPINFSISSGAIIKAIVVVGFFFLLYYLRDIVLVVLTAVLIASAIEPMIRWLKKYRIARVLSVVFIYISIGLILAGLFYFLLPTFLNDLSGLLDVLPKYIDSINFWTPAGDGALSHILTSSKEVALTSPQFSLKELIANFSSALTGTTEGFIQTISVIFGGVLSFILIIVLSFYLAVQEDGVTQFLRIVVPLRYEHYVIDLWQRTQKKIGYWMQGQLLLGIIIGILVYLGLTILAVPNAFLLAILAMIFEIIPVFGPILSAIPGILVALSLGGLGKGLLVAGFYVIVQQFENHLIYPLVVRKIVGVSPILVILAIIIGAKLAGFLGIILSVPLATALVEYLDDFQKDKIARLAQSNLPMK
ncbi:MAG: AI-2E family transporter [Candidatus Paceibacterota bacterium]|jgi:predicted PurR-regulated permease PerM